MSSENRKENPNESIHENISENFRDYMTRDEFRSMMEELRSSNAGQEKYARKQYRMSQITALCSALVLAIVIYACMSILPKVNATYENMDLILTDLKVITSELADADIDGMIKDVDRLVSSSEKNLGETMEKIEAIDIDGLNTAIQNLSDAVEPLANFFNRFR
jgi:hypothetical protein